MALGIAEGTVRAKIALLTAEYGYIGCVDPNVCVGIVLVGKRLWS